MLRATSAFSLDSREERGPTVLVELAGGHVVVGREVADHLVEALFVLGPVHAWFSPVES